MKPDFMERRLIPSNNRKLALSANNRVLCSGYSHGGVMGTYLVELTTSK
jgi:hypothetical protein